MKKRNAFPSAVGLATAALLAAPARLDDRPATDAEVRVEKVLKGRLPGSVVTFRQPGGVDGGRLFQMMGLPMLSEGDRWITDRVAGRESRADYLVADRAGPASGGSPALVEWLLKLEFSLLTTSKAVGGS